ncbi:MAG: HAMP domain-containing histidine kinase [Pseudobutyrivibrio sp.]|nr:HAMP domain-containing histidine kinase [Pseudobutyrivibrio sp.]
MKRLNQSVKKTIFKSNTAMVLVTLLTFLLVNVTLLSIFADTYEKSIVETSELDEKAFEAKELLEATVKDSNYRFGKTLPQELLNMGYQLYVIENDRLVYSNFSEPEIVDEYLRKQIIKDGKCHIYVQGGVSVITLASLETEMEFYSVAGEYSELWDNERASRIFIWLFLAEGLVSILFLYAMSQFFTRRLTKKIMTPLNQLTDGAKRVQTGNLTQEINYKGETEFEQVCKNFNEMQFSILKGNQEKEKYEKARRDMVAGISHDLRTPLTAIKGSVKALQDKVVSSPEMEEKFLDTAYRRTLELDSLIERLFYFSKLETGGLAFEFERVLIDDYLRGYIDEAKLMYQEYNLSFVYDSKFSDGVVEIDKSQMRRVFENLISNTIKYAMVENIVINVELDQRDNNIIIKYWDNGKGVPSDKLPHLFEEFYRVDESRSQKEGSGLGLYIVKYIVQEMHGSISVGSNQGLLFEMVFPGVEVNNG